MDKLNVRSLANMCKCSTQPIYLSFKNIDELKAELHKKIADCYETYLKNEVSCGKYPEYKARGMGYIRFAMEKPKLFKYLFMEKNDSKVSNNSLNDDMLTLIKNYSVCRTTAERTAVEMWVVVHGIATMCATNVVDWNEETISNILTDLFKGVMASERKSDN
jgi:hypothetical protein